MEIPKQFLTIGQSPIIIHTIRRVMESGLFDAVHLVVHPDWMDYTKKLLLKDGIKTDALDFIPGGKERIDSTQNALKALKNENIDSDDIVVIHDGVRPFINRDLLLRCIDKTKQYGATVATVSVKDAIMTIEQGIATGTPDRKKFFTAKHQPVSNFQLFMRPFKA